MRGKRDIEDEEIGSRSFEVQRGRAVEMALAHLRHGLGNTWDLYLPEEIESMEWILGEAWAVLGSECWQRIGFSFATPEKVEELIVTGEKARNGHVVRLTAARRAARILTELPQPGNLPPSEK